MATLTSTQRGSASLTVAPTQNTAPVHEFRCLYTRDLHKKAKKWHDGSLRFHTFNRRVMVYDDAKNYIGDLHYRQEEDFGEGVEINLDRGVKVEVGERVGETQTDLGPILERPRPDKPVPQARQTPSLTAGRLMSTGPSQRPKSLLEVLGPSQGRLGRSRLPLQSPYEQRQTLSRIDTTEPSPKRTRLLDPQESQPEVVRQPVRPRLPHPTLPSKPAATSSRAEIAPIVLEDVLELSSDEEPKRKRLKAARLAAIPGNSHKKGSKEKNPAPARIRKPSTKNAQQAEPTRNILQAPEVQIETIVSRSRIAVPRKARLLLGQPKPRPTLRCLLPLSIDISLPPSPDGASTISSPEQSIYVPPPSRPAGATLRGSASGLEREGASMSSPGMSSPAEVRRNSDGDGDRASSPLFIPEDANGPQSMLPLPSPVYEELPLSGFVETQESPGLVSTPDPPQAQDIDANRHLEVNRSQRTSLSSTCQSPDHPPGNVLRLEGGDTTRSFRRVFSENDALEHDGHVLAQGTKAFEQRSPLQVLENLASRRTPAKSNSPAKLQRWASDNAVQAMEKNNLPGHVEEPSNGPTGPWTAEEAFLLFDWWPDGLDRPSFWPAKRDGTMPGAMPGAGAGFRSGITTARQFLRDDVNVL